MSPIRPIPRLSEVAPEMVRRLGWIVAGMAALVARRFLRDPKFSGLILPLWGWLNRSARRFGRVRVQGPPAMVPKAADIVAVTRVSRQRTPRGTRVRLPSGRGWLVGRLGWEASGYGTQLEALLAEPEMVALMAQLPAMGRILRAHSVTGKHAAVYLWTEGAAFGSKMMTGRRATLSLR